MTFGSAATGHLAGRRDLTVDDVESLSDEVHCELWDGELILLPSELPIHQVMMRASANALDHWCPEEAIAVHSLPVELDRQNMLRPDVVVLPVAAARFGPAAGDVLLAGEVTSPWSAATDRGAKVDRYASAGIANYWIVDAFAARVSVTVLRLGLDGCYRECLHTDELVTLDEPWSVTLDLPAWTRRRDRLRAAASADG